MPLGDTLISDGAITKAQLDEALEIQKKQTDKKLGEILIGLGYINAETLDKALKK